MNAWSVCAKLITWAVWMVEWLERLDYGAESRRKVVSSRLGFAMRRLENFVTPAVNGDRFSN